MQHPDEGTVHAWLDGALPVEEARALEEHVAGCTSCAATVAEARGMVAGASRILASLDHAPAGVIPSRPGARQPTARRTPWFRRPGVGIAAAIAIVATGTTWAVTRGWDASPAPSFERATSVVIDEQDSAARETLDAVPQAPAALAPMESAAMDAAGADRQARAASPADLLSANRQEAPRQSLEIRVAAPPPPEASRRTDVQERAEGAGVRGMSAGAEKLQAETGASERLDATKAVPLADLRSAVADPVPAPAAPRQRALAREQAPVMSGRSLTETARAVAGCYALELGQSAGVSRAELPSVVRLAESTTEAAGAAMAPPPPAQGFRMRPNPLLVPPALDSGQLGWRMAQSDSVSMLIAGEGMALQVTFPAMADGPRVGLVTSGSLTDAGSWSAPVVVQRVPCAPR